MITKIGDVEIWRLLEIDGPFLAATELFPNAGSDVGRIIEALAPGSIDQSSGRLILPIQGFLLKTEHQIILVDSCVGNHKTLPNLPAWNQKSDDRFLSALQKAGLTPDDVDVVLCTHLHSDHVGWNTRLENGSWVPTFPNARYILPRADEEFHRNEATVLYQESVLPIIARDLAEMTEGAHELCDGVRLVPTPGHSPGHVSVEIDRQGQRALITGDALHSTAQCCHPEWHFKFDADPAKAATTRHNLLQRATDKNQLVLGNHFLLPSLGHVAEKGDSFSWNPV